MLVYVNNMNALSTGHRREYMYVNVKDFAVEKSCEACTNVCAACSCCTTEKAIKKPHNRWPVSQTIMQNPHVGKTGCGSLCAILF